MYVIFGPPCSFYNIVIVCLLFMVLFYVLYGLWCLDNHFVIVFQNNGLLEYNTLGVEEFRKETEI
jgi:hypothetical protein